MIFAIMEMFTSFRQYPSRKAGLTGLSIFMASYLGWIHIIKFKANIWVRSMIYECRSHTYHLFLILLGVSRARSLKPSPASCVLHSLPRVLRWALHSRRVLE